MNVPPINQRLAADRFVLDEAECHITVNQALARSSGTADRLIACCPARVYSWAPDGSLAVEYAACLECGTCLAVADPGTLEWHYPRGGFGIHFREG
ncbi:MAG: 4Fe-4S dicluster domain-containing protein [Propionibacteriaceae bacterium]|jgi:ferredoxin like protein|nr:4Fe-4S dicluster domain-containing protein [Propionibacteriaceae bacterium]